MGLGMAEKITDKLAKTTVAPDKGSRLLWDIEVRGFGLRVTAAGSKSFILNYRRKADGLERRWTIGGAGDWTTGAAREEAKRLKRLIDGGADPIGEHQDIRGAPTLADLCGRFLQEFSTGLRASTAGDYAALVKLHI